MEAGVWEPTRGSPTCFTLTLILSRRGRGRISSSSSFTGEDKQAALASAPGGPKALPYKHV